MKKRARNNVRMSSFFLILALFVFVVIGARVTQIAFAKTIDGVDLSELATKRTTKTETLKATRGTIYSSDEAVLAQNVSSYKLIAYLEEKRTTDPKKPQHVVDKEATAKALAPILEMEETDILALLSKDVYQTEFGSKGRGLTEITKEKIEELNLPGLDFVETQKRYYPNGDFLSYTLGYAKTEITEENDGTKENIVGELGLEKYYDDILKGKDGSITYQKDLKGYKIANTKEVRKDAEDGKDIYLTIDSNIQFFVEQALKEADSKHHYEWFTLMVADAKTGKILASSSTPSFDPNLRNLTNYLDYNVALPYEPGSTMKIFTYMAAMENGVYDGNEIYHSGIYTTSDGTEIGDWDRNGWGDISYDRGFALSSNVGVINLIERHMNQTMLRKYFKKLGFGSKTGIQLPNEASGKLTFKYETEVFNAGFGQGITTTPIQNIQALTSLTNDGMLLKPYLVEKIVDHETGEVIYQGKRKEITKVASTDTVNKIKQLMYDTVYGIGNTGSGFRMMGYNLIGKTGTSQIAAEDGSGYLQGADQIISSFAGIYPMDDPKVIIYASIKRPTNGYAKPIWDAVKSVVANISKYYGDEGSQDVIEKLTSITLPSYLNRNKDTVLAELSPKEIPVVVLGDGDKVIDQYPPKKSVVTSKEKVFLLTNGTNITIPNLWGWSKKEIETLSNLLPITISTSGSGYVTSQSLAEGTTITNESELSVTLEPKFKEE